MAPSLVNWVKYITDRESRGNSGPSSVAVCIRNSYGAFVVDKGFKLHNTTNIVAEARSVREGLVYCMDNIINNVIIESDSMVVVQILHGEWEIPWSISGEINCMNNIKSSMSVRVQHSLQEGNTLADFF